jgi:hypothetical protein
MAARTELWVYVYREITPDVWDTHMIRETRLQAFTDAGWRVLVGEGEIRTQMIEDEFTAQTQPFNPPKVT